MWRDAALSPDRRLDRGLPTALLRSRCSHRQNPHLPALRVAPLPDRTRRCVAAARCQTLLPAPGDNSARDRSWRPAARIVLVIHLQAHVPAAPIRVHVARGSSQAVAEMVLADAGEKAAQFPAHALNRYRQAPTRILVAY